MKCLKLLTQSLFSVASFCDKLVIFLSTPCKPVESVIWKARDRCGGTFAALASWRSQATWCRRSADLTPTTLAATTTPLSGPALAPTLRSLSDFAG